MLMPVASPVGFAHGPCSGGAWKLCLAILWILTRNAVLPLLRQCLKPDEFGAVSSSIQKVLKALWVATRSHSLLCGYPSWKRNSLSRDSVQELPVLKWSEATTELRNSRRFLGDNFQRDNWDEILGQVGLPNRREGRLMHRPGCGPRVSELQYSERTLRLLFLCPYLSLFSLLTTQSKDSGKFLSGNKVDFTEGRVKNQMLSRIVIVLTVANHWRTLNNRSKIYIGTK